MKIMNLTFNKSTYCLVGALIVLAILAVMYQPTYGGFEDGSGANKFYMVHAKWCPHCTSFIDTFKEMADNIAAGKYLKGKNIVAEEVNGDPKDETDAAKKARYTMTLGSLPKVDGFPSFFLKKTDGQVLKYEGNRDPAKMIEFLESNL